MLSRLTTRLFIATPLVAALGVAALWLSETETGDYRMAFAWYATRQASANPLLWPVGVIAALALLAWSVVAIREEWIFARVSGGVEVPLRHLGVVDERALQRRARRAICPALSRKQPRMDQLIDVLLGTMVDLGASELRVEPTPDAAEVVLVIGMDKLQITSVRRELQRELCDRFRLMLALEGEEGRGTVKLRSGDAVEHIDVELRRRDTGLRLKLLLLSRARPALTLPRLGLPEPILHGLRGQLQADRGLIVLCGGRGHGSTTTLYASGHYLYHHLRLRPGKIAVLEPHVSLGVPFMHQVEFGAKKPAGVLRGLLRGFCRDLIARSGRRGDGSAPAGGGALAAGRRRDGQR